MEKIPHEDTIRKVLNRYGLSTDFSEYKAYIDREKNGWVKLIVSVLPENGPRVVVKILREDADERTLEQEREKTEKQCAFAEAMRSRGIRTPKHFTADGKFCTDEEYHGIQCCTTVEEWCGEEVREINAERAFRIGELMARMHTLSSEASCKIGCGTLFSAVGWNDVDAFDRFCEITRDEQLDQQTVGKIRALRDEKLRMIREMWETLPKAAVQGDISINNLVDGADGLTVFDYNNAGDEVLISDLVMEGLLTAYEMELPEDADPRIRETFFPAFLNGYLSVRSLSAAEVQAAWLVYTLYHALWFTRILHREDSLEALVKRKDYDTANRLLEQMLTDMTQPDDGRFRK